MAYPNLGFGLGLRKEYYEDILQHKPNIDWFEIITENHIVPGGKPRYYLEQIRQQYPIVMHGVSLSLGSSDPIDLNYLQQVKQLATDIDAIWISDHLCWTGVNKINLHDLLPLPYTEEAIDHVVARIQQVQDYLGRQILIENVSSYVTFKHSVLSEWEFLSTIADRADCLILLDLNNIYVSSFNHGFDPKHYIDHIPATRIQQFHLAGHSLNEHYIVDTHDADIIPEVWDIYRYAIQKYNPISCMIERDDNMPPLDDLLQELDMARQIAHSHR